MDIIINDNSINPILNIEETIIETSITIDEIIYNPILNIYETVLETSILIEEMQMPGVDGKSAYEIAVENGFVGTEEQWLLSLKGDKGDKGDTGDTGAPGFGIPTGGLAGQILTKIDSTDYNTIWQDNNFTTALKTKLDNIQAGAEVNVNADWNATSGDAQILNKPTIPSTPTLQQVTTAGATTNVPTVFSTTDPTFSGIISVKGESDNGIGVYGDSVNSFGVYGISVNSFGVVGESINAIGVAGFSDNSYGVYGTSDNSYGVVGESINAIGVAGFSDNSYGVYGDSGNGVAGKFNIGTAVSNIVEFQKSSILQASVTHDGKVNANAFIKSGGTSSQFLKADGSVDNNAYLTSADLPSTLDLYATTSPDPVIAGYTALVRNIADARYNTVAVDVLTPTITGTSVAPTFCGAVISDPSILLGNPGVFNFSVIGKIRRTGGSTSSGADFFFSIYKRNLAGVEELIANSAPVVVPANGGIYVEYISIALWNNGIFLSTDRVVLKFYGIKTGGGSGAAYEFQFGGSDPVRGTAAISSAIIPNIYLRDLADVEKTDALNNEILYWNDADSLWEHSSVIDLLSPASSTVNGYLSSTDWTAFNGKFNLPSLTSGSVLFSNGTTIEQDNANFFWDNTNKRLNIGGIVSNTARVGIKAQGALSTDIAFRIRNSADTVNLLSVAGNGNVTSLNGFTIGSTLSAAGIFPSGTSTRETVNIRSGLLPSDTGPDIVLSNGQGDAANLSSTRNLVNISRGFNPTSGNGIYNLIQINPTINQTGGANGISRGLFVNPTLTAAADFRAIETTVGNVILNSTSGSVAIGTSTPVVSAKLTIESTTQGFLPPRMTTTQRNAIATPATGLVVYDTNLLSLYQYNGTAWKPLLSSVGISNLTATGTANSTTFLRGDNVWDKNFRWFDYVLGKTNVTETAVSGGVVQELSYAGTTEKRYRFIGTTYDSATDIIYTTFSGGVLSNPIAYKLITL